MDLLFNALKTLCLTHGFDRTYWVGYSGGLDSHVLLHLLSRLKATYPLRIAAMYVNHGLSPHAAEWAEHCAGVCNQLSIPFKPHTIHIDSSSEESLEALARESRYQVFAATLDVRDILLTAHHQDDQAETVLIQLLRGSGPKGLAAMPRVKSFARGLHARPLLNFTRVDLQRYAEQHQLRWIEDESNTNVKFVRNFLRHDVLPILKSRWPNVTDTLARVAENCAEMQQVLDEVTNEDLKIVKGSVDNTLSILALLQFSPVRQKHILRAWLSKLGFSLPSFVKLQHIQQDLLHAREDKMPHLTWNNVELHRFQGNLYAMYSRSSHDVSRVYSWDVSQILHLPDIGVLSATQVQGQGVCAGIQNVTVRFRRGGEKIKLPGRQCSHTLKNLFQQWKVPFWERDKVPLIYVGETLAAIVGYAVHDDFIVKPDHKGYLLSIST